jgi:hypothetical protein
MKKNREAIAPVVVRTGTGWYKGDFHVHDLESGDAKDSIADPTVAGAHLALELVTIRGERFVIPVKVEQKRRVHGVVHGASSSGQTVFVEPLETIEHNNELVRLLDEDSSGESDANMPSILEGLQGFVGKAEGLTPDASLNVDHYLYGMPKRQ